MSFWRRIRGRRPPQRERGDPTVVAFAGGMGTQILQAAAYFSLKQAGEPVWADLRYFDREPRMSLPGEKGRPTHWFWQLDHYGLTRSAFQQAGPQELQRGYLLADGPELNALAFRALRDPATARLFGNADSVEKQLPSAAGAPYLCIHVRRGDYLNVASHVVSDDEFVRIGGKFSRLLDRALILSDSAFADPFKARMDELFSEASYLDSLDPYTSHWVMRRARVLVCSNSTFSLTAGLLNSSGLIVMPKQWFGPGLEELERQIQGLASFQLMA